MISTIFFIASMPRWLPQEGLQHGPWRMSHIAELKEARVGYYVSKCDGEWYVLTGDSGGRVIRYPESQVRVKPVGRPLSSIRLFGCTIIGAAMVPGLDQPPNVRTNFHYRIDAKTGEVEELDFWVNGVDAEGRLVGSTAEPERHFVGERTLNTLGLPVNWLCASPTGTRYAATVPDGDRWGKRSVPVRWDAPDALPTFLPLPPGVEDLMVTGVNRHGHVVATGRDRRGVVLLLWKGDDVEVIPGPAGAKGEDGWDGPRTLSTHPVGDDGTLLGHATFEAARRKFWVHAGGRTAWLDEEFAGLTGARPASVRPHPEGKGFLLWVEPDEPNGRVGGWYEVEWAPQAGRDQGGH